MDLISLPSMVESIELIPNLNFLFIHGIMQSCSMRWISLASTIFLEQVYFKIIFK
jgi:hypothetical protein